MAVQRFSASLNLNEYRDVSIKVTKLFFFSLHLYYELVAEAF